MTEHERRDDPQGGVRVSASAPSLGSAMAAVADGLAAVGEESPPSGDGPRHDCAATADRPVDLLLDYLDELEYQSDVRRVLPVDNAASVERGGGRWRLSGSFRGADTEAAPERFRTDGLAAPRVDRTDDGWAVAVSLRP